MPESFALTRFVALLLRGIELRVYQSLGLSAAGAAEKAAKVNGALAMELLVAAILIGFFLIVRMSLSVERPGAAQQVAEMIHEGVGGLANEVIGHGYQRFQAYITCIALFILLNNLSGLIPGIETPTAQPEVPLGLAILTFLYYNYHGLRAQGVVGYIKHLCGPIWWMAWLILPVELVSHFARIMSLTIRLYANMFASDMLALAFFSLIPLGLPVVFLGLHVFVSCIQAFVFTLLTMIYLSLATAQDH